MITIRKKDIKELIEDLNCFSLYCDNKYDFINKLIKEKENFTKKYNFYGHLTTDIAQCVDKNGIVTNLICKVNYYDKERAYDMYYCF